MRKLWKKMKNKQGFTLMEMLIVVAIIAVLVAIAIPVYQGQVHKAKVAADWANLRAYYAELQLDYLTSGAYNYKCSSYQCTIPALVECNITILRRSHFLTEIKVKLQAGNYLGYGEMTDGGRLSRSPIIVDTLCRSIILQRTNRSLVASNGSVSCFRRSSG